MITAEDAEFAESGFPKNVFSAASAISAVNS